jgi:hypothetical protein
MDRTINALWFAVLLGVFFSFMGVFLIVAYEPSSLVGTLAGCTFLIVGTIFLLLFCRWLKRAILARKRKLLTLRHLFMLVLALSFFDALVHPVALLSEAIGVVLVMSFFAFLSLGYPRTGERGPLEAARMMELLVFIALCGIALAAYSIATAPPHGTAYLLVESNYGALTGELTPFQIIAVQAVKGAVYLALFAVSFAMHRRLVAENSTRKVRIKAQPA